MQQSYKLCLLSVLAFAGLVAVEARRPLIRAPRDARRTGDYMIVLDTTLSAEDFRQLLARISKVSDGATVQRYVENVAKVVTASLSPYSLEIVRHMEGVDHIEEEDEAVGDFIPHLPWHLDRLDQVDLPLDWSYEPIGTGEAVDVYVLDSGIRYDHSEFEFRAKYAGYDPYDAYSRRGGGGFIPMRGQDCHGHGTHVASLCGGKTFGSAKKVTIYSVRVLSCENSAPWSVVLDGLDFVLQIIEKRMKLAVVTMSLSGSHHDLVNQAIKKLYQKNVPVITVAGNGEVDCCSRSPASSPHAITVAGTRRGDGLYRIGRGTNFGRCVDIFAPGELILGASHACKNCTMQLSGTSMAAPLVAGIAAVHMTRQPLMTPAQIKERIINNSLKGVVDFEGMPEQYHTQTPNTLLHLQGSCGSSELPLSRSSFHTPMFPDRYLSNLHCEWDIRAEEGQQVQVTFHTVSTESNFDLIQVMDGSCGYPKQVLTTMSGELTDVTFLSQSPSLCIVFTSDGLTEMTGFNATYTKLYKDTNITVVAPALHPPAQWPFATTIDHHQDTKDVQKLLREHKMDGFRTTWCNTYRSGQRGHSDLIMTNRTGTDTICLMEVGNKSLPRVLKLKQEQGYYLWHISTRVRGRQTLRPTFYLLLKPLPSHLEHIYYIRETEEDYLNHLAANTRSNYTLLSHSFYRLGDELFASSAYIRDVRLTLDIPISHSPPPKWTSFYNLTPDDFESTLQRMANQSFFPSSVESYSDSHSNSSLFSAVFTEQSKDFQTWFKLGVNKTTVNNLIETSQISWKLVLSLGYDNSGREEFYVQFVRKLYDDL